MLFNMQNRYQLDKIIITAMDRFVWFVLLVVMSHLVTEYTRVIGHTGRAGTDDVTVNDSFVPTQVNVQNMILYPNQDFLNELHNDKQQQQQNSQQKPASILSQIFAASANNAQLRRQQQLQQQQQYQMEQPQPQHQQQQALTQSSWMSFRPIIDSIFEIPISTLRAVSNLLTRLTGSYTTAPSISMNAEVVLPYQHSLKETTVELRESKVKVKPHKLMTMREQNS